MDDLQNVFVGERLKELRLQKGRTQEEVALFFGVSKQAVSKWEKGQSMPDILLLPEIAQYFGVNMELFFDRRSKADLREASSCGEIAVQVRGLKMKYDPKSDDYALRGIDMDIYADVSTAIMGPSGSGKSTLLNCISGLERPTEGTILVRGQEISRMSEAAISKFRRGNVGFIFQQYNLVETLNVRDNICLPYKLNKEKIDTARLKDLIERLGLRGKEKSLPSKLSGGQQQRVAIARALLGKNRIIFADEPTGALDVKTGADVLDLLLIACKEFHQPLVMVTHDPSVAARCDVVYFLRDGSVVQRLESASADEIAKTMLHLQR